MGYIWYSFSNVKGIPLRRAKKEDRERRVLLALVDLYLETGRPVGSNTLRETGLDDLSSATIRNYFAKLEEGGFLLQPHTSGGRVPTDAAYEVYAQSVLEEGALGEEVVRRLRDLGEPTKEVALYLHRVCELVSELSGCAVFLSAPRFDQDFVLEMRVMPLDESRCLCVMLTDFGSVLTEILPLERGLTAFGAKRIEGYFGWRLTGQEQTDHLSEEEEAVAQKLYNELMVRYITRYSAFTDQDLTRSGFSRLLDYPEFHSPAVLARGLALFESPTRMRKLLRECERQGDVSYWIGKGLDPFVAEAGDCAVVGVPYNIGHASVGAIALLGPTRLKYRSLFALLRVVSERVSNALEKSLYKFKIEYRQPETGALYLPPKESLALGDHHE
jgi:heat-inducible transcriptional repressor